MFMRVSTVRTLMVAYGCLWLNPAFVGMMMLLFVFAYDVLASILLCMYALSCDCLTGRHV